MLEMKRSAALLTVFVAVLGRGLEAAPISIVFDYSHDGGFFTGGNSGRQAILQAAADALVSKLDVSLAGNQLAAVSAGGVTGNNYTARPFDPSSSTQALFSVSNLNVAANTIVIYAGGAALSGAGIGGGAGFQSATGNQAFFDALFNRGHTPYPPSYAPFAGSISFDNDSVNWHFGLTTAGLDGSETDFYSVAQHELGHVLGIGASDAWDALITAGNFTGANSLAAYKAVPSQSAATSVPLDGAQGHWADGSQSFIPGTSTQQEAAMDPVILNGTRKVFTDLDYAGLDDIGWDITPVPEPSTVFAYGVVVMGLGYTVRRRMAA